MKVVILAGGLGTRLREETGVRPKPMVEIGGKPVLWHIMKIYSHYGLNDFIVCLGYKGFMIKEYFSNYALHMSDVTFDMAKGQMVVHQNSAESWKVTLVDTGDATMTGGRIKRVAHHLDGEPFCMTYGDGVADVDIGKLLAFHKRHGAKATLTATRPPARFGAMKFDGDRVLSFQEKPLGDGNYINGGFFVLSASVLNYIEGDQTTWERGPMENLAREGHLRAMRHDGFWQPMDTMHDKAYLEGLWDSGRPPWKVWA
jgi:glucose-1-phosphate cytidylyltransferase